MAIFHGDAVQTRALLRAIDRECSCQINDGLVSGDCPAHRSLMDQRFLDGLCFCAWLSARLCLEEETR
jgi:hypothetical protein